MCATNPPRDEQVWRDGVAGFMSGAMKRRDVLIRLGLLGAGVGGAWWLRDRVVWRKPQIVFGPADDWLPYAERRANVPTVMATVGGRPVRALIDSGAQFSVIDRSLFNDLGAPPTIDMPVVAYGVGGQPQLGKGVTLDVTVGQTRIPGLRAAILGLGPLASEEGLGTPLILGQDVLGEAMLDIDVARRRIRLLPRDAALPPEVSPVAVRRGGRALGTQVTVEGATIEAVVDTGASALLALSREAAESAGLLDGRPQTRSGSIVLGGAIASIVVEARTVTFGDQLFERVQTPIYADVALPGFPRALVGMEAFAGRRVLLDLGGGRLSVSRDLDLTIGDPPRRRGV